MGERKGFPLNIGEYYQLIRQCGCGSGLISSWYKDENGVDVKACDRCSPGLLRRIFTKKFSEIPPLGRELYWEGFLRERGCERVEGLEDAKRVRGDRLLIRDPVESRDIYALLPKDYAESVLKIGNLR